MCRLCNISSKNECFENNNFGGLILNTSYCDYNSVSRKTIILVHGWPLDQRMFDYQIKSLIDNDYRVITYDISGFGNSEVGDSWLDYIDFENQLDDLVSKLRINRFDLLGFSMGGAIAALYASKSPYVDKLCLVSAAVPSYCQTDDNPFGQSVSETEKLIKTGWSDRQEVSRQFSNIFFHTKPSPDFLKWFDTLNQQGSLFGMMTALETLKNENLIDKLPYITCEVGIFHGENDKICSVEMAKLTHSIIEDSTLHIIPNAGHGMFYEQREKFNALLIDFLNS